jgi:hypothetical protein
MTLFFWSDEGECSQTQLNSIRGFFCTDGTVGSIKKVQIGGRLLKGEKWKNNIINSFIKSLTPFYIAHENFSPIGPSFVYRMNYLKLRLSEIWTRKNLAKVKNADHYTTAAVMLANEVFKK